MIRILLVLLVAPLSCSCSNEAPVTITGEAPTTVELSVPSALASDPARTVTLRIDDVTRPQTGAFLRVFVNKPDATAQTPIDDPHYVGAVSFFGDDPLSSFRLDVSQTLARLGETAADVNQVTVILVSELNDSVTVGAVELVATN